jgi:hypothetical protein
LLLRDFTFFATPWIASGSWAIRGQLSGALGPALPSACTQSPLYSYMFSLILIYPLCHLPTAQPAQPLPYALAAGRIDAGPSVRKVIHRSELRVDTD